MSINQEIADSLRGIATLLEEQGASPFRVNAYQRAASTVVHLDEPISEIIEQKGLRGLIALAGIGEGIARSIYEYLAMGRMGRLESLRGGHDPAALFKQIPSVGSTLANRIIDALHIDSLEALEMAAYNRCLEKVAGVSVNQVAMVQARLAQVTGRRRPGPREQEPVAKPPGCWVTARARS